MNNFEQAVKDLQDNLIVLAELERRQSETLKVHSHRLAFPEAEIAANLRCHHHRISLVRSGGDFASRDI